MGLSFFWILEQCPPIRPTGKTGIMNSETEQTLYAVELSQLCALTQASPGDVLLYLPCNYVAEMVQEVIEKVCGILMKDGKT
jgi:hypothetical protein